MSPKKTVLITGASSGIGKAMADQFALRAHDLVLVSEDGTELATVADNLARTYPHIKVRAMVSDLTRSESPQELHDEIKNDGIEIDILVNNAGVGQGDLFWDIPLDKHLEVIRLNVEALTRLTHLHLPEMVRRNSGKILNVGSIAGFVPGPTMAVYHASKAYVNSLSESLSEELKGSGVTLTCLCPGAVETNWWKRAGRKDAFILRKGNAMQPEAVARAAVAALLEGRRMIIPGFLNKAFVFLRRIMPISVQAKAGKRFYRNVDGA